VSTSALPTPFEIAVPNSALQDLRNRLQSARWPAEIAYSGWDYGTEQTFLRSVVERWADGWRDAAAITVSDLVDLSPAS